MSTTVKEKCRACLNDTSKYASVFDTKFYDKLIVSYSSMISLVTSVEIRDDDEYPQNICNVCIEDVDIAFKFRLKCVKSNESLRGTMIDIKEELDDGPTSPLICEVEYAKSENNDDDVDINDQESVDRLDVKSETVDMHVKWSDDDNDRLESPTINLRKRKQSTSESQSDSIKTRRHSTKQSKESQSDDSSSESNDNEHFDNNDNTDTEDEEEEKAQDDGDSSESSEAEYQPKTRNQKNREKIKAENENQQTTEKKSGQRVYRFFKRNQSNRLKCDRCPRTFFKQSTLDSHIEKHGKPGFKCNICYKSDFMTGGGLKEHLKVSHKNDDLTKNAYNCDICNIDYVEIDEYIQHMKSVHRDEDKPVKPCPECGKLLRKHNWDKHLKIHYGERKFKCEHCPMTFLFINNFRKHQITHTGERKFQCEYCEFRFKSKANLLRHIEHVHMNNKPKRKRQSNVTCDICGFEDTKKEMAKHMKANHMAHFRANYRGQEYNCRFCSREFTHKPQYELHFLDHPIEERKILQEEQEKEDEQIKAIMAEKSSKQEMCICEQCGQSVAKKNMEKHKQSHIDPHPYSCQHCGKKFTNQHNKNVHEKLHEGIAPYVCEVCGRGFGFKQCYNKHMYTHYSEKPYACELCGYKFIYKSCLKSHMAAHNRGTAMKPKTEEDLANRIKCLLCDGLFSTKGSRDKHIRKIHKVIGYVPRDPSTAFGPTASGSSTTALVPDTVPQPIPAEQLPRVHVLEQDLPPSSFSTVVLTIGPGN